MKLFYKTLLLCLLALNSFAQYNDPNYAKPTSGYGADGTHTVAVESFKNPNYLLKDIEIYHPSDITGKVPTIFYSHAFGGNVSANISGMLNFVAMKGYAIVYVPYQTTGVTVDERYTNLLSGFRKAARDYPNIIDTTRVGFMGHSFGGGASFGNAFKCFTENNWGSNGRFIYALAQWYTFNIDESQLENFPANTKLLTEIFDDDTTNDHRMAIDIFEHISIPDSEKDFILLKSDTVNGRIYAADHVVPNTSAAFDAFDYYAYYRFIDALCDYTFNGSAAGKNVALGNGSAEQVTMPAGLKSLIETDNPQVVYPESKYEFPCSDDQNLRKSYCPQIVMTAVEDEILGEENMLVYPNPTSGKISVRIFQNTSVTDITITNVMGQQVLSKSVSNQDLLELDLSTLVKGLYFVSVGSSGTKLVIE